MTKELTVSAEEKELQALEAEMRAKLAEQANKVDSSDIVMSKVMMMQGLSQLVMDGKAKFGDFVDSVTEEIIGSIDKPITFVPIHYTKVWIVRKKVGTEYEYSHTEPVTFANKFEYEYFDNGIEYKRSPVHKVFAFINGNTSMPSIIDFKGMSGRTGKQLATQAWTIGAQQEELPFYNNYELSGIKDKNEKGTFVVLKVSKSNPTDPKTRLAAYKWLITLEKAEKNNAIKEKDLPNEGNKDNGEDQF